MKRVLVISTLYFSMVAVGCSASGSNNSFDPGGDSGQSEDSMIDGKAGTGGGGGGKAGAGGGSGGTIAKGGNQGDSDPGNDGAKPDSSDAEPQDDSGTEEDVALDISFEYDSQQQESGLEEACVDQSAKAEPVPLDIFFMLDASTSMNTDCNATPPFKPSVNSKWCNAINAIAGYVSSPAAAGNRAAIQYFEPYVASSCSTGAGYDTPAVGLGLLSGKYDGHAVQLVEAPKAGMNWAGPYSLTPTEGALRGLAGFTKKNITPGRVIIGILVTDGIPSECDRSDSVLAGIAAQHFASTKIHTFMVGMTGANFDKLETWAKYTGALSHTGDCGGTMASCHHYNVGNGDPAVFINALNKIQNSVLACSFKVVQPTTGVLDPSLVAVEYYPGNGGPMETLTKVADENACGSSLGWYFDNPDAPQMINLCSASCTKVQADTKAQVKIRIACEGA